MIKAKEARKIAENVKPLDCVIESINTISEYIKKSAEEGRWSVSVGLCIGFGKIEPNDLITNFRATVKRILTSNGYEFVAISAKVSANNCWVDFVVNIKW